MKTEAGPQGLADSRVHAVNLLWVVASVHRNRGRARSTISNSRTPRHLLRDRDAVYGRDFRQRTRRIGIDAIASPIHAPKANSIVERVIGTLRRECLDHLVVLNEQHLMAIVHEIVGYYNQERPHRTLGLETPERRLRPVIGAIRSHPILNGLHHVYERAA